MADGDGSDRIVVIGGGLAGLSAAVSLADAGRRVVVLERLGRCGGRCRSVRGPGGTPVDWGQHLMLGAYRATRRLAARLGTAGRLRFVDEPTPFVTGPGEEHAYRVGSLPSPLHALPALVGLSHLGWLDRLGLGRAALGAKFDRRFRAEALDRIDAATWLRGHGQGEGALRGFWEPLGTATCNGPLERTSAALLAAVIDEGMFATREDALPLLPEGTLAEVLVDPAVEAIRRSRGEVRTRAEAASLDVAGGAVRGVTLRGGERVPAAGVVLAAPSWAAAPLLAGVAGMAGTSRAAERLGAASIVSVDGWFDRPWLRHPFAGLLGTGVQWVFAHGPGSVAGAAQRVSMVVSDAGGWLDRPRAALEEAVLSSVRSRFRGAVGARMVASLVVREPRATFVGGPGQGSLRPEAGTPSRGLVLAGDWTATGLPATIEGAVRSGVQAAARLARSPGTG
jgi:squalene-associated FAD-dependent desaturase